MSNSIKYTTGSESLALKKGNFYIGTGDVEKGPTSSTDYYNGITPPSGGYTIYLNKESGGPSIYTASNDAQLISLTNSIANQSYSTVNECLNYFNGQTDKLCVNTNYEGIVTDGLVLNLDAGFTPSYPKNGTTWYDIGGTNNGTLTNGPTFSSANGGIIVFDGADDFIDFGSINSSHPMSFYGVNDMAIEAWVYPESSGDAYQRIIDKSNGGNGSNGYALFIGSTSPTVKLIGFHINGAASPIDVPNNPSYNLNAWNQIAITKEGSVWKLYINGALEYTNTVTREFPSTTTNMRIGSWNHSTARELNGNISSFRAYHKTLSSSEVLQNYNTTKGRFGL